MRPNTTNSLNIMASVVLKYSRCGVAGHVAKNCCNLDFKLKQTRMEEREARNKERANEHKAYLARKQARDDHEATMTAEEREEERKKYEARKQARQERGGAMMTAEERVVERTKYIARCQVREQREQEKLVVWDCPRCKRNGHMLEHCPRPKTREELRKEERLKNEARHQKHAQAKLEDLECASQSTASTAMTVTLARDEEEEVRCKVEADKDVRRLAKKLREIVKLEACNSLDPKQKAKLEKKLDVEIELDTARGLARARAQNELRV